MARTVVVDLPYPSDEMHQNARVGAFILARAKKRDKDVGEKAAKKAMEAPPYKGTPPVFAKATLALHFRFPNRRARDLLNYAGAMKSQLDGCVVAGVIQDDKCTVLERITDISWSVNKTNLGVTATFEEAA